NTSSSALACLDCKFSANDACSILHVPQPHSLGFQLLTDSLAIVCYFQNRPPGEDCQLDRDAIGSCMFRRVCDRLFRYPIQVKSKHRLKVDPLRMRPMKFHVGWYSGCKFF